MTSLNEKQSEVLKTLCTNGHGVRESELDGRSVRALKKRGLVDSLSGHILATAKGKSYYDQFIRKRVTTSVRRGRPSREARVNMISHAITELERALPRNANILVGRMLATEEEVIAGLKSFCTQFGEGKELINFHRSVENGSP